jgi:hypothetical protein
VSAAADPAPPRLELSWQVRDLPLPVRGLCARGDAATRLVERLLAGDDATLARLEGVAGAALVCLRGAADDLPWAPGVEYLGVDPAASGLLLPTTRRPGVPADLLLRALAGRTPPPLALVPGLIVPLAAARALERPALAAWLAAKVKAA